MINWRWKRRVKKSVCLLKNDSTLPWDAKKFKNRCHYSAQRAMKNLPCLGNYSGTPSRKITFDQGNQSQVRVNGRKVLVEPGCHW